MRTLKGRTAFVTGSASGIGLAISEALLAEGARVVLADRDAATLDRECARLGSAALGYQLDVTDRPGWRAARHFAENSLGPVEILVNNAGLAPDWNELAEMPVQHFDQLISVMLTGVFNGISTFGGRMRELDHGHIVNMSSMAGLIGLARQGAYAAAKFGVVGLSEALRSEMQPHGVGVSVVCPGRVKTNLLAGNRPTHMGADEGLAADVVANHVIDAIQNDVFYVITNPEHKALIANRSAQLIDAFDLAPTL